MKGLSLYHALFFLFFLTNDVNGFDPKFQQITKDVNRFLESCNYTEIQDDSENEDFVNIEGLIQVLSWSNCSEAREVFEKNLVALDVKTSWRLPIPFDRTRCGWQVGSVGTVLNRHWMSQFCHKNAEAINHCCAQHFDCYLEQKEQKLCDERFLQCNDKILKLTNEKTPCKAYMDKSKLFNKLFKSSYDRIGRTEVQSEIQDFDGNLHKSGGFIEQPLNASILALNVFRLESVRMSDYLVAKMFEEVLTLGWSRRFTIDSAGLIFESCRRKESDQICLTKLNVLLQEITEGSEYFEEARMKFDKMVTQIVNDDKDKLTVKKLEEKLSEKFGVHIFLVVFECFGFLTMGWRLWVWVFKWICNRCCPTSQAPTGSALHVDGEDGVPNPQQGDDSYVPCPAENNILTARNSGRVNGETNPEEIPLRTIVNSDL